MTKTLILAMAGMAAFALLLLRNTRKTGSSWPPLFLACLAALVVPFALWATSLLTADSPPDDLIQGFRMVEVASVSDAIEQLYGKKLYMSHDMRPLFSTKFAGPAVTVELERHENTLGSKSLQAMMDVIDESPAGSVYVMVLDDGLDFAGLGGLMSTAMKYRGFAGAIVDGGIRDTPQVTKLQFPVFSRGVVPSTTINHFRIKGKNTVVPCAGVTVHPSDIVVADMDGVVVVPAAKAAEVLKRARELDEAEHSMLPFIEKYKSIRDAVAKFGRL